MEQEESYWRLKSRATWIKQGDINTKFFHKFENARREKNTIWKIRNGNGQLIYSQNDITNEAVSFFGKQFQRSEVCNFKDILWGIEIFPKMFDEEANEKVFQKISEEELLGIMKSFKADKCPGPDGWTIEFYIHFFDPFKSDLLKMVEGSRMAGSINSKVESTNIALIPKKDEAESFMDY